jgi:hypothetical protein
MQLEIGIACDTNRKERPPLPSVVGVFYEAAVAADETALAPGIGLFQPGGQRATRVEHVSLGDVTGFFGVTIGERRH